MRSMDRASRLPYHGVRPQTGGRGGRQGPLQLSSTCVRLSTQRLLRQWPTRDTMPDPRSLRVGDLVRFVAFPEEWSRKGWTAPSASVSLMRRLIRRTSPSRIAEIDGAGLPCVHVRIRQRSRTTHHSWLIAETTGWRRVRRRVPSARGSRR